MIRRAALLFAIICILSVAPTDTRRSEVQASTPSETRQLDFARQNAIRQSLYLPLLRADHEWAQHHEWTPWALQDTTVLKLYAGSEPGWLWAITPEGLRSSKDYGRTWELLPTLGYLPSLAAVAPSGTDSALYVTSSHGTVLSSTNGITWTVDAALAEPVSFLGWVEEQLYIGVYGSTNSPPRLLQRSAAGLWEQVGMPLPAHLYDLAVFRSELYAATQSGLYRLDSGDWLPVTVYDYAAESRSQAVLFSSLSMLSIAPTDSVALSLTEVRPVRTILVDGDTMFVGTSSSRGIYRSRDGVTWIACDVGITGPFNLTVSKLLAGEEGRLFAATYNDGVFMSANGGERWMALDRGLPHSTTGFGILLDGVSATAMVLMRDQYGQQTLGAVFNRQGLWVMTVTHATWLADRAAELPPKAVLVVGPVDPPDHTGTQSLIDWAERLAAIMVQNGMQVERVYWPDSTWENVRAAISGASVVVYKGHGFGLGDIPSDPTEMYGSVNGFCLVDPSDPAGARLGTQDMLVTTSRLAEDAVGFFFCCYCGASSGSDTAPVSEALARRRIEAYSSTVLRMGGGAYFALVNEEAILEQFFLYPDRSLGDIYRSVQGEPDHLHPHILWPEQSVWFSGNPQRGWHGAFVGDPTLTARDVLGR